RPLRDTLRLVWPLVGAGLPLVYFALLPHIDDAWKIARDQNALAAQGWGMVLGTIGPLLLLALGRPRLSPRSFQDRVLVIWPLAAVFVYWVSPPYPIHALETVTLPLAVLALRGWRFVPARRVVLAGCALVLVVPGLVYLAQRLNERVDGARPAYVLLKGDRDA